MINLDKSKYRNCIKQVIGVSDDVVRNLISDSCEENTMAQEGGTLQEFLRTRNEFLVYGNQQTPTVKEFLEWLESGSVGVRFMVIGSTPQTRVRFENAAFVFVNKKCILNQYEEEMDGPSMNGHYYYMTTGTYSSVVASA